VVFAALMRFTVARGRHASHGQIVLPVAFLTAQA
jgi:hypothetical protein